MHVQISVSILDYFTIEDEITSEIYACAHSLKLMVTVRVTMAVITS